jgi:hypothetical protein
MTKLVNNKAAVLSEVTRFYCVSYLLEIAVLMVCFEMMCCSISKVTKPQHNKLLYIEQISFSLIKLGNVGSDHFFHLLGRDPCVSKLAPTFVEKEDADDVFTAVVAGVHLRVETRVVEQKPRVLSYCLPVASNYFFR